MATEHSDTAAADRRSGPAPTVARDRDEEWQSILFGQRVAGQSRRPQSDPVSQHRRARGASGAAGEHGIAAPPQHPPTPAPPPTVTVPQPVRFAARSEQFAVAPQPAPRPQFAPPPQYAPAPSRTWAAPSASPAEQPIPPLQYAAPSAPLPQAVAAPASAPAPPLDVAAAGPAAPAVADEVRRRRRTETRRPASRTRLQTAGPLRAGGAPAIIATVALVLVLLESSVDLVPDDAVVWVITPLRIVLAVGLAAGIALAPRLAAWSTWFDIPLALLVLTGLVASSRGGEGYSTWRWTLTSIAVFYLAVVLRRQVPAIWRAFLGLAALGVAIASLIGVEQFLAGTETGFCRVLIGGTDQCSDEGAFHRIIGTFSNPNLLASFLVLLAPFAIVLVGRLPAGPERWTGWALLAAAGLAVLLSYSRGGILAAGVGVAALWLLQHPSRRRLLIAGGVAAGAGVLLLVLLLTGISAAGVRADVWRAALGAALRNPLGVGPGRGGEVLQAATEGEEPFEHAHNLWLNFLLEYGWLGFLAVVAATLIAATAVVLLSLRGSALAAPLGASLAGFAVASTLDHTANAVRISILLAVVLGLLAAELGAPDYRELRRRLTTARPAALRDAWRSRPPVPRPAGSAPRGG